MKPMWWRYSAVIAFIGMVVVNGLAGSSTLIGGVNTAQISDSYPNLFAPAGFTFAIWGVIYLMLAIFTGSIAISARRAERKPNDTSRLVDRITPYFVATCGINAVWLFCWQYRIMGLSVLLMLVLLGLLIQIRLMLTRRPLSASDRRIISWPFQVYLGWITVATVANITIWLRSLGWDGLGLSDSFWMVVVMAVSTAVAVTATWRLRDIPYALVIIWAFWGILAKHLSTTGWNQTYPGVITLVQVALAIMLVVTASVAYQQVRPLKS